MKGIDNRTRLHGRLAGSTATILATLLSLLLPPRPAAAYVEVPFTLGRVVNESTNIVLLRVEKVDKEKNLIVYRKVRDLKGQHPGDTVKHNVAKAGFHPREWQNVMAWAEVGQTALFFHNGSAGEVCIDNYWYQVYAGDWWAMSHAEPYLLRTFAGKPQKLAGYVEQMLKGQEVAVPCMVDGNKEAIHLRTAKVQRLKASLKITEYDAKRDFAGWGAQDLVPLAGMAGFTHYGPLARVDPGPAGVAACDFDADGKPDFCLFGEARVALLQNGGGSFNEVPLALNEGARSAAWADVDGDGKPDLLLACPSGPRLFLNEGQGKFKDVSGTLPTQPYWNLTAATFVDAAGPDAKGTGKRPDILLADGFAGLQLWRNRGGQAPARPPTIEMGPWQICGPFDNADGKGVDAAYPPEARQTFDPAYFAAKHEGKGKAEAAWKPFDFPDGQLQSVKVFRDDLHAFMVVYLHRTVTASGPGEMAVSLGGGGPIKVWANGALVLADKQARSPAADQLTAKVPFRQGKNDLLLKFCYVQSGRSAYFKGTVPDAPAVRYYDDATADSGLPEANAALAKMAADGGPAVLGSPAVPGGRDLPGGPAASPKVSHLLTADVNGDGRPDVLVGGGTGLLLLATPTGRFAVAPNAGVRYAPAGVTPAFGDFDGDGKVDLAIPQADGVRLLAGRGDGSFVDVSEKTGVAAAGGVGRCTSVAFGNLGGGALAGAGGGKGKPDLLVGCLRGPNRLLRNQSNGTFVDATDAVGLGQRIFNTRGVCLVDLNRDGVPDAIFANAGQESNVLLSNPVVAGR